MIASLYQNGSTLVGVSPCAMRLIFDAQTARRNHRFINCSARYASSSQNRSSFAQARFTFVDRSRAAIEGSRFIGRDDSGYFGESVLETDGRRGLWSLRDGMAR